MMPRSWRGLLPLMLQIGLGTCAAQTSSTVLALRVANLMVPAGGTAQIQVFLSSAAALVSGELTLALDPTIFGPIGSADVFSVTGDQVGTANIQDRNLDVQFKSMTGGIGRRPDLPVMVVSVPVLATAATGATSSIAVKSGAAPWKDNQNVTYAVTSATNALIVGGSLSIADVSPGGGSLPAGAVVRIDGTGFTASSTVAIDGVEVSPVQFVSPQEIDFTLAGAADLTARRVTVSNSDGAQVAFFSALRGSYVARPTSGALAAIQPIFPQQLYPAAEPGNFLFSNAAIALQNPSRQPVDVIIKSTSVYLTGPSVTGSMVTLPPGGIYVVSGNQVAGGERAQATVVPTAPIRVAVVDPVYGGSLATAIPVPVLQAQAYLDTAGSPLAWNCVAGSGPPAPLNVNVVLFDLPVPFTVAAATRSGGSWLSVSPTEGTTCNPGLPYTLNCPASSKVILSADPSGLAPGGYNGWLTITPQAFGGQSTTVPVALTVSATRQIFLSQTTLDYGPWTPDQTSVPAIVSLTSNADPMPFTVTVVTKSGQNWLSASPVAGNTPATLTLTANPSKLPVPGDSATVTVTGPANSQTISVAMETATPQPQTIGTTPSSMVFSVGTSQPPPAAQNLNISAVIAMSPFTISVETSDGGNWFSASTNNGPGVPFIAVSVNQAGLAAGTYHGTVTISSSLASGPAQVPVTLYVWDAPPPIAVSPSSLSFTVPAVGNMGAAQTVNVSTGSIPMYYDVTSSTTEGAGWLFAAGVTVPVTFLPAPTPTTVTVTVSGDVPPGVYHGTVTISAPPGSSNAATVAVTLTVTPAPPPLPPQGTLPLVTSVLNGASQIAGAVSPGEIVTIFGQNFGPSTPAGFAIGANGKVATTLGGAEVLFDGISAPLLYANATQINAIVPYEVAGPHIGNLQLNYNGTPIPVGGIPIADSMPAIFTLDSSGQGAAAVLNQDNSINSAANPAARGSTVQIYATGEGLTTPAGVTGEITGSDTKQPQLPVGVTIGGVNAAIAYAASAPHAVSGLFQVNAVVPAGVTPGSAVPLLLTVGTARSQANATIAVK